MVDHADHLTLRSSSAHTFSLFRPQSKKKKKEAALRKNAQIGDEVTTIGGISGRIIAIKEDTDSIILETGTDRNKINVKRWAISTVDSQVAPSANETNTAKISKKAEKDEAKKDEKTEEKVIDLFHICPSKCIQF